MLWSSSSGFRAVGAALVGLTMAAAPALLAQPRERAVYVSLVDKTSEWPAREVAPTDIIIREDGTAREVLRATPARSEMPVAIIVDNSQPAAPAIADLRRALSAFVAALDGLGPMALITIGDRPTIVADYTASQQTLQDAVGRLFHAPNSGATLLDAINDAARGIARRTSDRAAIVVVATENVEFSLRHSSEVLESLRRSGASLHAVVLTNPGGALGSDEARQRAIVLDRGTRESGGIRRDVLTAMAFQPTLARLAAVLKAQYRVVYARPESLLPPERITVAAARPGVEAFGAPARDESKQP